MKLTQNKIGMLNGIGANDLMIGDDVSVDFYKALDSVYSFCNMRFNIYDVERVDDVERIINDIRRAGIKEFSVSGSIADSTEIMQRLAECGCTFVGNTTAYNNHGNHEILIPALLFNP